MAISPWLALLMPTPIAIWMTASNVSSAVADSSPDEPAPFVSVIGGALGASPWSAKIVGYLFIILVVVIILWLIIRR
jgi:hypothetical protein